MPIEVQETRVIRETEADYTYMDGGEAKTEKIRVKYFDPTWNEEQAEHDRIKKLAAEDPTAPVWPHEKLAKRIAELPDLTKGGKPFPITPESLGGLGIRNCASLQKAISDDIAGKDQPAK